MKLQRYTLAASTLVLLAPCLGADNPFARWDKIRQENILPETGALAGSSLPSDVPPVVAKTQKTVRSLEYFSPNPPSHTRGNPAEVASEKSGEKVTLERLTVKENSTSAGTQPGPAVLTASQQTPVAASGGNSPSRPSRKPVGRVQVMNAAFSSDVASGGIQQTSGVELNQPGNASANPFAEFLKEHVASEEEETSEPVTKEPVTSTPAVADTKQEPIVVEKSSAFVARPDPEAINTVAVAQSGPQSPTVTLQWAYHGDFNLGQQCRCDLIVENTGQATVRNVITEAVVPKGVEVVTSDPEPTTTEGSATWSFGEMKPGEIRKVELTVVPRVQGELQMNAFVRVTGVSSSSISVKQPLIAIKVDGPENIEVGQMVNYTATVTNPGTGEARDVVIQAMVPDGLEHRSGKMLTIEVGTLNPGETRQARLSLTGTKGGNHELAVRVIADGGLTDQTIDTVAIAEPRLNIAVQGVERAIASQPAIYEVIVVNEGKVESNNVRAKYRVPEGFDFIKANRGGKFNTQDRTIDWFVGTLGPGQLKNFNVTLQAVTSGQYRHQVGVISEYGRVTMADHTTAVQGNANLDLSVVSSSRSVQTGAEVSFEIRIQNSGTTAAESVGLSCELPAGLELLDISGPSEFIADSGVVIFRSLPSLAGGESAVFVVKTRCSRAGKHSARVRVASETSGKTLIDEQTITGLAR